MLFYVTSQLGMQHENGCEILISLLSHTLQMIKYDFKSIRFWGVFILELVIVYWPYGQNTKSHHTYFVGIFVMQLQFSIIQIQYVKHMNCSTVICHRATMKFSLCRAHICLPRMVTLVAGPVV
jgi:hypothetical protein